MASGRIMMQNPSGGQPLQPDFGMSELSRKIYQTNPKLLAKIMELEAALPETSLSNFWGVRPGCWIRPLSLTGVDYPLLRPCRPRRLKRFRF